MTVEIPTYMAVVEDESNTINVLEWWRDNEHKLPHWSAACKHALEVNPSSAAVERVFSLLNNSNVEEPNYHYLIPPSSSSSLHCGGISHQQHSPLVTVATGG